MSLNGLELSPEVSPDLYHHRACDPHGSRMIAAAQN